MSVSPATPTRIDPALITRSRSLTVTSVTETGRALGLGLAAPELSPLVPEWRICGPALTMRLIPLPDPEDWKANERALGVPIAMCPSGGVVVVDCGGRVDYSPFGVISAVTAKSRGVEAVVIDGACREVQEVIAEGFPTFARGVCSGGSHGLVQTTALNTEPVALGSTAAAPGDLVIGDADGVAVVPVARLTEVPELAEAGQRRADEMREFMREGPDLDRLYGYLRGADGDAVDLRHLAGPGA